MKNLKVRPLDDRVVVEPVEAEERMPAASCCPTPPRKSPSGTVRAVGPGKLFENGHRGNLSVAVGDVVIYGKYAGTDIEINGHDVKILRESDILAKVTA